MPARWKHIEYIVTFQSKIGIRLGNKLTIGHGQYHARAMKVSLAVQTLSDSVAKTIQYLRKVFKLPEVMVA